MALRWTFARPRERVCRCCNINTTPTVIITVVLTRRINSWPASKPHAIATMVSLDQAATVSRFEIMKTKLHQTKNGLREKTRLAMIELLNQQLADVLDLGLQAKQAHWNVKGPNFIALHELFDKVAEELEEFTDDIAERAVELGGVAEGTVQTVSKNSRLKAYPLDLASGKDHVAALSSALAT